MSLEVNVRVLEYRGVINEGREAETWCAPLREAEWEAVAGQSAMLTIWDLHLIWI